ncbi:unnamed protein product, partial [Symbiodinium sp. CCMP2592]
MASLQNALDCVSELVITDVPLHCFRTMVSEVAKSSCSGVDLKTSNVTSLIAFDVLLSPTDWAVHWSDVLRGAETARMLLAKVQEHCAVTVPCDLQGSKDRLSGTKDKEDAAPKEQPQPANEQNQDKEDDVQQDGDGGKSAGDNVGAKEKGITRALVDVNTFLGKNIVGALESAAVQNELKLLRMPHDGIQPRVYKHVELLLNVLVEDIYVTHFAEYESNIEISLQSNGKQTELKVPLPLSPDVRFPFIGKVVHSQSRLPK